MYNGNGQTYQVFCEFFDQYGYMFISKQTSVEIKPDLIGYNTNEVLVRHFRSNGTQYDTIMKQISTNSSVPLSIQYSKYVNYTKPENHRTMAPYLFLGLLPKSIARAKNIQGYRANDQDFLFTNCDRVPHSYVAFFFNPNYKSPTDYHLSCCHSSLMMSWLNEGIPASTYLSHCYAFQFEMHMGGCGGYAVNGFTEMETICGAALGMRFGKLTNYQSCQFFIILIYFIKEGTCIIIKRHLGHLLNRS